MQHKRTALLIAGATVLIVAAALAEVKKKIDAQVLSVGSVAPAYALPDQDSKTHTLADDHGKVILLAFYPADFTGGCTIEAHALSGAYKDLKAMGVVVYGVSVQDTKSHKQFCTKEGIPYTLLADTNREASQAYGVLIPGPRIANRVTYIIGRDGKIAYVDNDVNHHLTTCGDDWVTWLKAHPEVTGKKTSEAPVAPEDLTGTHPLAVGTLAPNFTLPDQDGKPRTLADEKGKVVLLEFYPADFTLSCTAEAIAVDAVRPQLKSLGVVPYGISVQSSVSHKQFAAKTGVTYSLLADTGQTATKDYGLLMPVGGGLARRVTYIVDKDGRIAYVDMDVQSHLATAGKDWVTWLKAHPEVTGKTAATVATQQATMLGPG